MTEKFQYISIPGGTDQGKFWAKIDGKVTIFPSDVEFFNHMGTLGWELKLVRELVGQLSVEYLFCHKYTQGGR